tara:strand:+ start:153 stop:467 length:315 start_codon:yes stop_codon:yes gene_type:complete
MTFGILEGLFIWWALTYIFVKTSTQDTQYIELNETQFRDLQDALHQNSISPHRSYIHPINNQLQFPIPPPPLPPTPPPPPPQYVENTAETNIDTETFDEDATLK